MSTNINNFVRPTEGTDRRDINKLLELIHDLVAPEPEEEGVDKGVKLTDHIKLKTSTGSLSGATLLVTQTRARRNFVQRRKPPTVVNSYPLIHTLNSFSGITFPKTDTKFGARMEWDNTGYITIADQATLAPTNLTLSFWLYHPTSAATRVVIRKGLTQIPYQAILVTGDLLRFRIRNTSNTNFTKDVAFTPNTWQHWVLTWNSSANRMRVYLDKVLQGSDTTTSGTLDVNTESLSIGANGDGANKLLSGARSAHIALLDKEVDQTWVNNNFVLQPFLLLSLILIFVQQF